MLASPGLDSLKNKTNETRFIDRESYGLVVITATFISKFRLELLYLVIATNLLSTSVEYVPVSSNEIRRVGEKSCNSFFPISGPPHFQIFVI